MKKTTHIVLWKQKNAGSESGVKHLRNNQVYREGQEAYMNHLPIEVALFYYLCNMKVTLPG